MKIPCKEASLDFNESNGMHNLPPKLSNENPMTSMHIPGNFFSNHYSETVLFSSSELAIL